MAGAGASGGVLVSDAWAGAIWQRKLPKGGVGGTEGMHSTYLGVVGHGFQGERRNGSR
jgi:hypothetical protein